MMTLDDLKQAGSLSVQASCTFPLGSSETILAEFKDTHPQAAGIEGSPNAHLVILDLTTVGAVSQHEGEYQYRLATAGLDAALPTLFGKPIHITSQFDAHFVRGQRPWGIGTIVGWKTIDNGNETQTVRILASLWSKDFPAEVQQIQTTRASLGASYEVTYSPAHATITKNVIEISRYAFSGGAILLKSRAAHPETRLLVAAAGGDDAVAEQMDELIADQLTTKDRNALPDSDFALIQDGERRFPIQDEAHRKNAWARLPQAKNLSDEERSTIADRIMRRAKSAGDAWAKDYHKADGTWTKSASKGRSDMAKYPGIPDEHEKLVDMIVATATTELQAQLTKATEAARAQQAVIEAAKGEVETIKASVKEQETSAVATQNKITELETALTASKAELTTVTAELKTFRDADAAAQQKVKEDQAWEHICASFGLTKDLKANAKLRTERADLITKLAAGTTPLTAEEFVKLTAGGKPGTPTTSPTESTLRAGAGDGDGLLTPEQKTALAAKFGLNFNRPIRVR